MTAFRCVVFAAVSSAPQAGDDKASIPSQIENARALIHRRGWLEVAPPLVVPGQSRSIDFLHEAIEEIEALRDLVDIAKHGDIDLVICRDYDRLARTRMLLTQISAYLSRCSVQIYAMDKPVEPIPTDELRRQHGIYSSATVEAFAGLEAEREIGRMTSRRFFGMNNAMRNGKWRHSKVAYGYTRARATAEGVAVMLDVPEIVPAEAEVVRRIDRLYLDLGLGTSDIARQLNLEGVRSPSNGVWYNTSVINILRNPFYAGYVVWGLQRRERVYDPVGERFVKRSLRVPSYERLRKALRRTPGLQDLLDHIDDLAADDVVIVYGEHAPLRTFEDQQRIEREIEARRNVGGRGASARGRRPRLFSGLLTCAECGGPFVCGSRRDDTRIYYRCLTRQRGGECAQRSYVREARLYEQVMDVIRQIASTPGAAKAYLDHRNEEQVDALAEEAGGARTALEALRARRKRWDTAYESGVIDLTEYGRRIGELADEQAAIEDRLAVVERRFADATGKQNRLDEITKAIHQMPELTDYRAVKLWLRRLIAEIVVQDGKMIRLVLNA